MRISTNQLYDRSIASVLDNSVELSNLQQQLASGKKLLRPSDDPVGAAQVVRLTEDLDKITQYKRNNDLLQSSLEKEEVILSSINDSLNRARVLMIQSGNGVYDESDLKAIAIEIGEIRDEVFGLMNTQNSNDEYSFAGDDGIKKIRVSDTQTIQSNSSGKTVFEDVLARYTSSISASSGVTSSSLSVTQQAAFDAFHQNNYDAVTAANNQYRITILATDQVRIDNVGTGATVATQSFVSGQPFVFEGLQFNLSGTTGNTVDFQLDTPQKKNLAETLNDFFESLNDTSLSNSQFQEAIADGLVGLDNGLRAVNDATAALGGRVNVAESVYESNLDLEIANKSARSVIEDVDYAEAVSELSKQETALQAAQATFSRVTGLSLFDFI
jgi:flagellar hook-associated protein 3 FlgL